MPKTLVAKTLKGYHHYFRSDVELASKVGIAPWGDFKAGANSYVVAPGSVNRKERGPKGLWFVYRWWPEHCIREWWTNSDGSRESRDTSPLFATKIARLPDCILDLLREDAPADPIPQTTPKPISPRMLYPSRTNEIGDWPFKDLAADPEIALTVLRRCGATVKALDKAFKCPIPGHVEKRASAALWLKPGGVIMLHDFHRADGREWWPLPDVYHACQTGDVRELGRGERAIWWLRALHDIGAIKPASVERVPIPEADDFKGTSRASVAKVFDGLALLLGLRELYQKGQRGTPFSFSFASTWCGIPRSETVREALRWLMIRGYVVRVGETAKPGRYGKKIGLLALGKGPITVEVK